MTRRMPMAPQREPIRFTRPRNQGRGKYVYYRRTTSVTIIVPTPLAMAMDALGYPTRQEYLTALIAADLIARGVLPVEEEQQHD